ncbi:MAG: hypothetical protein EXR99_07975 [Gemmataceae bacterium]|nr:hypothetical protein [Gemmataceae bacterium]
MAKRSPKTAVVAFKVEKELADLLNGLPNKSAFIRKAIASQLGVACPLCKGAGVVSRGVNDRFSPILEQFQHASCDSCGNEMNMPMEASDLDPESRVRLEQFLLGGPLYCNTCYEISPSCHDCGWHIGPGQTEKHHLSNHCDEDCHTHHGEKPHAH